MAGFSFKRHSDIKPKNAIDAVSSKQNLRLSFFDENCVVLHRDHSGNEFDDIFLMIKLSPLEKNLLLENFHKQVTES